MATTTSKKINDFTDGFGDAAERYRAVNEKLLETGKKTASAALEGYQKTIASYVDFRQQLAEATLLLRVEHDEDDDVIAALIAGRTSTIVRGAQPSKPKVLDSRGISALR